MHSSSQRFRRPDSGATPSRRRRRRSPWVLLLLLIVWSAILGLGLAQATTPPPIGLAQATTPPPSGTVDVVPERYQLGQEIYLQNCSTCHVPLPPAVMPTQTWRDVLPDSQHYGAQITPIRPPYLQIVWNYISVYSRPTQKEESVPYRLAQSRYFKALHPKVEFTEPVTANSCAACHPKAALFDYRTLTPEWENAP